MFWMFAGLIQQPWNIRYNWNVPNKGEYKTPLLIKALLYIVRIYKKQNMNKYKKKYLTSFLIEKC